YSDGSLKFKGEYPSGPVGDVLNLFDPLLTNTDRNRKIKFCNSFSSQPASSNGGKSYSNQAWCVEHLELAPTLN
ncbi:MAG: hypothetical protein U1A26_02665, partial [Candidatus Sungbacteria bacterium]|nr:hypothetical protein [Candidatus Sungbacteria bacterium]